MIYFTTVEPLQVKVHKDTTGHLIILADDTSRRSSDDQLLKHGLGVWTCQESSVYYSSENVRFPEVVSLQVPDGTCYQFIHI